MKTRVSIKYNNVNSTKILSLVTVVKKTKIKKDLTFAIRTLYKKNYQVKIQGGTGINVADAHGCMIVNLEERMGNDECSGTLNRLTMLATFQ